MASFYDPNLEADAKRRRLMAQQMMKSAEIPATTEVVSGIAIPRSPLEVLAKTVQQGLAGYQSGQADELDKQAASNRQNLLASAVGQMGTDPKSGALSLLQDPTLADEGLKLYAQAVRGDQLSKAGVGGATGAFADRLIEQGVDPLQALMIAKGGLGQGRTVDANGNVITMTGVGGADYQKKYDESRGSAEGKGAGEANVSLDKRATGANQTLGLIKSAREILPNATSGTAQNLWSGANRMVGNSTAATQADAQLKTIASGLISNVPRMEGPQSDADVRMYSQAAGDIANPAIPIQDRLAALDEIERLQTKYQSMGTVAGMPMTLQQKSQQPNQVTGAVPPQRDNSDPLQAPPPGITTVTTPEDYNKLPSGTLFMAPDGTRRRKP